MMAVTIPLFLLSFILPVTSAVFMLEFSAGLKEYAVGSDTLTMGASRAFCKHHGKALAVLDTEDKFQAVSHKLTGSFTTQTFFVNGARVFLWSTTLVPYVWRSSLTEIDDDLWALGQPDIQGKHVHMVWSNGTYRLATTSDDAENYPLCETDFSVMTTSRPGSSGDGIYFTGQGSSIGTLLPGNDSISEPHITQKAHQNTQGTLTPEQVTKTRTTVKTTDTSPAEIVTTADVSPETQHRTTSDTTITDLTQNATTTEVPSNTEKRTTLDTIGTIDARNDTTTVPASTTATAEDTTNKNSDVTKTADETQTTAYSTLSEDPTSEMTSQDGVNSGTKTSPARAAEESTTEEKTSERVNPGPITSETGSTRETTSEKVSSEETTREMTTGMITTSEVESPEDTTVEGISHEENTTAMLASMNTTTVDSLTEENTGVKITTKEMDDDVTADGVTVDNVSVLVTTTTKSTGGQSTNEFTETESSTKNTTTSTDSDTTTAHAIASTCATCYCTFKQHTPRLANTDVDQNIARTQKYLTVNVSTLSKTIRKRICARDDRLSSQTVGYAGCCFLVAACLLIFFMDATSYLKVVNKVEQDEQRKLTTAENDDTTSA